MEGNNRSESFTSNMNNMSTENTERQYAFDRRLYGYFYFMFAAGAVGVVANAFTLVVIARTKKMRKSQSCILIVNQTVCDLVACLAMIATFAVAIEEDGELEGRTGVDLCRVFVSEALFLACFFASTFNLVSITFERYLLIVHPMKHRVYYTKTASYAMIALSWLGGLCFLLPTLVTTTVVDGECKPRHEWAYGPGKAFYIYSILLGTFLIPLVILLYGYGRILRVLSAGTGDKLPQEQKKMLRSHRGSSSAEAPKHVSVITRAQINLTKTMLAVAVAFVVSAAPHQIYFTCYQLLVFNQHFAYCYALLAVSLVNCLINPFIYACAYTAFRRGAVTLLTCDKLRSEETTVTMSTLSSSDM